MAKKVNGLDSQTVEYLINQVGVSSRNKQNVGLASVTS